MLQICVQDSTVNVEVQDSTHFWIHSLWSIRLKWSNRCKQRAYVCWFTDYSLWLGPLLMQIDRKFKNEFYCTVSLKKLTKVGLLNAFCVSRCFSHESSLSWREFKPSCLLFVAHEFVAPVHFNVTAYLIILSSIRSDPPIPFKSL